MSVKRASYLVALLTIATGACDVPPPPVSTLALTLRAESDPGVPLEGVAVTIGRRPIGETNSYGLLQTRVEGRIGQRLQVDYRCPAGHRRAVDPPALQFQHFEGVADSSAGVIESTLRCPPDERIAAFVVRSRSGAGVPIWIDDREIGPLGPSGVAHYSVRGTPGTSFSVRLDTSSRPELRPQSPVHRFTLLDGHEVFVITQDFESKKRPKRKRRRKPRIIKIE